MKVENIIAYVDTIDLTQANPNIVRFDQKIIHGDFLEYLRGNIGKDGFGDIALLHSPVDIRETYPGVKPARLPAVDAEFIRPAIISGFGETSEKFPGVNSPYLLYLELYLIDRQFCVDKFGYFNGATMICAGHETIGTETSYGDSGGGLVEKDSFDEYILIGLLSYGDKGDSGEYLDKAFQVFTKVQAYVPWIKYHTNSSS